MAQNILIASGKGGVGKSSFAVGIAKALAKKGKKVLLVDADIGLRSLDLLLSGTENVMYDWGDALFGRCELSAAILSDGETELLTCPVEYSPEFTPEAFSGLIRMIDPDAYDYIFIDAPAGIGAVLRMAVAAADKAIVLATPDSVSVRSACIAANVLSENGIGDIRLIINRFRYRAVQKKKLLNIDGVIDETQIRLLGVVPEDEEISYGHIGSSKQDSTAAFRRIADRLLGENVPLFD